MAHHPQSCSLKDWQKQDCFLWGSEDLATMSVVHNVSFVKHKIADPNCMIFKLVFDSIYSNK